MSKPPFGPKAFNRERCALIGRLVGLKTSKIGLFPPWLATLAPGSHSNAESPDNAKYTDSLQIFSILKPRRLCDKSGPFEGYDELGLLRQWRMRGSACMR